MARHGPCLQRLRGLRRGIHRQVRRRARGARAAVAAGRAGRGVPADRARTASTAAATTSSTCSSARRPCTASYDECAGVTYDDVHADPDAAHGPHRRALPRGRRDQCDAVVIVGSDYTDVGDAHRVRLQRPHRGQPRRAGPARAQRVGPQSADELRHAADIARGGARRRPRLAVRRRRQPRRRDELPAAATPARWRGRRARLRPARGRRCSTRPDRRATSWRPATARLVSGDDAAARPRGPRPRGRRDDDAATCSTGSSRARS